MDWKIVFLFFMFSFCGESCYAEKIFYSKGDALKYYMESNNDPENARQIRERHMGVVDIDGVGGDDVYIINPNYSGTLHGDGGGVFLCQGKTKDCSDSYFCEADVVVLYEHEIKVKGPKLRCKK